MDEGRINKLGLAPAEPMLKEIREIKSARDLQRMILNFNEQGIFVPFGLLSRPDNHNPTETIADVFASGLGLPDRDYYLKPEPRFREAREKYQVHVATMFKLAGYDEKSAKAASETVFQVEEKLGEKSLDNVALRDPANTDVLCLFYQAGSCDGLGRVFCVSKDLAGGPECIRTGFYEGSGPPAPGNAIGRLEDVFDVAASQREGGRVVGGVCE
jgi:predicted metalloendopeptidase